MLLLLLLLLLALESTTTPDWARPMTKFAVANSSRTQPTTDGYCCCCSSTGSRSRFTCLPCTHHRALTHAHHQQRGPKTRRPVRVVAGRPVPPYPFTDRPGVECNPHALPSVGCRDPNTTRSVPGYAPDPEGLFTSTQHTHTLDSIPHHTQTDSNFPPTHGERDETEHRSYGVLFCAKKR